jgi:hypothetical protein
MVAMPLSPEFTLPPTPPNAPDANTESSDAAHFQLPGS